MEWISKLLSVNMITEMHDSMAYVYKTHNR